MNNKSEHNSKVNFLISFEYLKSMAKKSFCTTLPLWLYRQVESGGEWTFTDKKLSEPAKLILKHTIAVPYDKLNQFVIGDSVLLAAKTTRNNNPVNIIFKLNIELTYTIDIDEETSIASINFSLKDNGMN